MQKRQYIMAWLVWGELQTDIIMKVWERIRDLWEE